MQQIFEAINQVFTFIGPYQIFCGIFLRILHGIRIYRYWEISPWQLFCCLAVAFSLHLSWDSYR